MKTVMCLIVLTMLSMVMTSCGRDRKVPFEYPDVSPPDHEGLDSLGMADFFDHISSVK